MRVLKLKFHIADSHAGNLDTFLKNTFHVDKFVDYIRFTFANLEELQLESVHQEVIDVLMKLRYMFYTLTKFKVKLL